MLFWGGSFAGVVWRGDEREIAALFWLGVGVKQRGGGNSCFGKGEVKPSITATLICMKAWLDVEITPLLSTASWNQT